MPTRKHYRGESGSVPPAESFGSVVKIVRRQCHFGRFFERGNADHIAQSTATLDEYLDTGRKSCVSDSGYLHCQFGSFSLNPHALDVAERDSDGPFLAKCKSKT
jgi:hypothetical protein